MSAFEYADHHLLGTAIQAVLTNDLEKLKILSRRGFSMRTCDNQGLTPLHHSLRLGLTDFMEFLINRDEVDVNEKCHNGNTPLHYLCNSKDIGSHAKAQLCQRFARIERVNVSATNNEGLTPLHFASYSANIELMEVLIGNNAELQVDGSPNVLSYMLEDLESTNWQTRQRRDDDNFLACIDVLTEACPLLVHQRDPQRQLLPFQMAMISRFAAAALRLIPLATDQEIEERAGDYTSLAIAAGRGLHQVVDALLLRNANPNTLNSDDRDTTALQMACLSDQAHPPVDFLQTIKRLAPLTDSSLLHHYNVNPYEICVDNNALESFLTLATFFPPDDFTIGTNVYLLPYGETPLGYLLRERNHNDSTLQIVRRLLEQGKSDVNGNDSSIPCFASLLLHSNLNNTSERILQLLVNHGARIDLQKRSWLGEHVAKAHPKALLLLVKYGLAHLEELNQKDVCRPFFVRYLTELTLGDTSLVEMLSDLNLSPRQRKALKNVINILEGPKSLMFFARKSLRSGLFAKNGVCDLRDMKLIQELPIPIKDFVLFSDLDVDKVYSDYWDASMPFHEMYL